MEGVRYLCIKCEFSVTSASSLKLHIEIKHDKVRYPCDKCGYVATKQCNLKQHIESKHKEMTYNFDNANSLQQHQLA